MKLGELAQLITSVATLLGVLGGMYVSLRNAAKIEQVHKATNSMKDELVAATKIASKAEGRQEQRDLDRPQAS